MNILKTSSRDIAGYECVAALRSWFWASYWTGYIKIPVGHKYYGMHYEEVPMNAHGGLTYSGDLFGRNEWWLGFDCAHTEDLMNPKDIKFVTKQLKKMAKQLSNPDEKSKNKPESIQDSINSEKHLKR